MEQELNKILLLGFAFYGVYVIFWAIIASYQPGILKFFFFMGGLALTTEGFAPFDRAEKVIGCLSMGRTE